MERLIKIIDSGNPRYTLEPSHIVLGRMYDHDSEELVVEIPKSESESVCTLIIADTNKTPLYSVEIKDGRYKIPSIISQHHRVLLAFSFTRNDGYVKGSEIAVGDFESTIKPFGFEPIVSSTSLKITPQTNEQVFVPETGAYYDKVSVDAVTSSIDENISPLNIRKGVSILGVDGNLEPDKPDQNKTINPTTNNQVVVADTGYELASVTVNAVTNEIDGNIQPNNIKKDVEILGVTGTLDTIDLSDATATANDIVQGKTAYIADGKVTGNYIDRLQWKCDNVKSLASEFQGYTGTDYSILDGLDTSKVENFERMFDENLNMTDLPILNYENATNLDYFCVNTKSLNNAVITLKKPTSLYYGFYINNANTGTQPSLNIRINNSEYITNARNLFYQRKINNINDNNTLNLENCTLAGSMFRNAYFAGDNKTVTLLNTQNLTEVTDLFNNSTALEGINELDFISVTNCSNIFYMCQSIKEIYLKNTQNVTNFATAFYWCLTVETIKTIDLYSANNVSMMFFVAEKLKNLTLKNIKISLQIGSGTSWGHLLTNESLLNTAKELWDNTNNALGGARTLTMSTTSKTNIQSIYVKLITPTAEQEAEDPYINNKKPCVECTSTDEGAMTLEEYIISKNWSIA